ncbi:MAG TPA: hypothetical protein VMQ17_23260 [Candidatus Sulfotelmatobacter sp.]|nr:hypothetical protein [Candidatus Sulfotelmatobacter sp.]
MIGLLPETATTWPDATSSRLEFKAALNLEGPTQANRNDEDAPEEYREISDAEQSEVHLIRQKG